MTSAEKTAAVPGSGATLSIVAGASDSSQARTNGGVFGCGHVLSSRSDGREAQVAVDSCQLLQSCQSGSRAGATIPLIFPIIGARDYIDQRGFIINECPTCKRSTVFSVYDTKRKLTLYFLPTLNVRSQMVMECMTCHGRWGIGEAQADSVQRRLMSQMELSAFLMRQQEARPGPPRIQQPTGRTYYQVLQVDPLADPDVVEAAFKRLAMKYHPDTSKRSDRGRPDAGVAAGARHPHRPTTTGGVRQMAGNRSAGGGIAAGRGVVQIVDSRGRLASLLRLQRPGPPEFRPLHVPRWCPVDTLHTNLTGVPGNVG